MVWPSEEACPPLPHCPAPAAHRALLFGPLASLPVTAECALCFSTEPEIWDRDLSVTSQSAGPSAVPQGWPEEPRAAVHAEWREEEPEVTQATPPPPPAPILPDVSAFARLPGLPEVRAASLRLCSLRFVSMWVGQREKHSLAFLVRRFPAGWFHPCSLPPLSLREVQSVARQPEPCEA